MLDYYVQGVLTCQCVIVMPKHLSVGAIDCLGAEVRLRTSTITTVRVFCNSVIFAFIWYSVLVSFFFFDLALLAVFDFSVYKFHSFR